MSKLSGHQSFSDVIQNKIKIIGKSEYIYFDENDFVKNIKKNMKESNFIN